MGDARPDDVPRLEVGVAVEEYAAVDLRRVPLRAAERAFLVDLVDDDVDLAPDHAGEALLAHLFCRRHEAVPALFLDFLGHGAGEIVGRGAGNRLVAEAADAGELRLAHPVEQELEILLGLAGEADDERRSDGKVGAHLAPAADALQRLFLRRRAAHRFQHLRRGVLEGDVEVRQDLALGHQRNDVVDMRIGIDVVQAHPDAELAQRLA